MAGYVRQEAGNIVDTNVISASHFNNEYNAIAAAFSAVSGHKHDGTTAEGAPITVIGPAQDFVASASSLTPKAHNTYSLGTTSFRYTTGWFQGAVTAAGGFAGNLTGNVTGNITGNVTGNASTATALQTARNIILSGDATGSASFDGTANATISTTLANTAVTPGSYGSASVIPAITVDSKGRLTSVSTNSVNIGQTATGLAVLQAVSQADARSAIGITATGDGVVTAGSASAAQTALGITATGQSVTTAASQGAARTAIGITATGDSVVTAANAAAARSAIDAAQTSHTHTASAISDSTAIGRTILTAADALAVRTAISAPLTGAITSSGLTQSTNRLLGRTTAGTGALEEISLGDGLAFSGSNVVAGAFTNKPTVGGTPIGVNVSSTSSLSSTVTDISGIPNNARKVTLAIDGLSTNGNNHILIQLGTTNPPESTGYTSASSRIGAGASTVTSTAGFVIALELASRTATGLVEFIHIGSNRWIASGNLSDAANSITYNVCGGKTLSAALDRIRLTTVGGSDTFDAGTMTVFWEV